MAEMLRNDFRDFPTSLQEDRLIEIFVGAPDPLSKPYCVQQTILTSLSDYFGQTLRSDTFVEGREGRLRFPDDHNDVWEILLYWTMKQKMPELSDIGDQREEVAVRESLLMRCWILGDKYQVSAFEDETMVELLGFYQLPRRADKDVLKLVASATAPESKLRRLIAEELVKLVYDDYAVRTDQLNEFDGLGFLPEFARATECYHVGLQFDTRVRFGGRDEVSATGVPGGTWQEYLVGDKVPRREWQWDGECCGWSF